VITVYVQILEKDRRKSHKPAAPKHGRGTTSSIFLLRATGTSVGHIKRDSGRTKRKRAETPDACTGAIDVKEQPITTVGKVTLNLQGIDWGPHARARRTKHQDPLPYGRGDYMGIHTLP
jgi:hypothetical protein